MSEKLLELSGIAFGNQRYELALDYAKQANQIDKSANTCFAVATCYQELGESDVAFKWVEKAYKLDNSPEMSEKYGDALVQRGEHKLATKVLTDHPTVYGRMLLASAYVGLSEIEKAVEIYKECIKLHPTYLPPYLHLAPLIKHDKNTPCQPNILESYIGDAHVPAERDTNIHNVLGRVYEHWNDFDKSFKHYKASANLRRKEFGDWKPSDILLSDIINYYTPERFDTVKKSGEHCPLIFVVGMPRSGTTLTEQILVSHPYIDTRGETQNLVDEIAALATDKSSLTSASAATEKYLQRRIGKLKSKFIIDKMPGNFHYLGLMYQLFPNAKFVYCKRNALDNCFSCYATLFANGHPWSYNLKELAAEYRSHEQYMKHWFKVLPKGTIYQIDYEDMVSNQENTSRELLNYIGVKWHSKCSEFYKVKRDVKTASLAQVIRPIYTTSINRADHYSMHLKPLREALHG